MQNFQSGFNPFAQNISIVKSYFKKPRVLTLGILYAVSALLSVISGFIMMPVLNDYLGALMKMPGFTEGMTPSDVELFKTFMNVYVDVISLASIIPSVIMVAIISAAFFIIYNKSKNADPTSTPKAGVLILFILSIVQLVPIVMLAVMLVFAILIPIIASISVSGTPDAGILWVATTVYALVFGILTAIMLVYFINQVRYYNSVRKSLTTINLTYKGAGIFGVFSIIYGVSSVMSSFSVLTIKPTMQAFANLAPELAFLTDLFDTLNPLFGISAIASLLSATTMILNGITAMGYKKHIRSFTEGYSEFGVDNTVAAEPVSAPAYEPAVVNEPVQQMPQPVAPAQPQEPQFEPVIFNVGQTAAQALHCPRCGTPIKEGDVFCKACGTKL